MQSRLLAHTLHITTMARFTQIRMIPPKIIFQPKDSGISKWLAGAVSTMRVFMGVLTSCR